MPVNINISSLGNKFQDYRKDIPGESFNWGPVINASKVDGFVFHHSVTKQTAKNDGNWKTECDVIANSHIAQGWDGVGYRFIICSDGTVAYVGDLSHGGSAVANHNDHLFSACLVGDFTKELPTAAQIHSAHLLAKFFLTEMPQYPLLNDWTDVKGHKEFNPTACPGTNWKKAGDSLHHRIMADLWQGYPDPKPSAITPPQPPTDPCASIKKELEIVQIKLATEQELTKKLQAKIDKAKQDLN